MDHLDRIFNLYCYYVFSNLKKLEDQGKEVCPRLRLKNRVTKAILSDCTDITRQFEKMKVDNDKY